MIGVLEFFPSKLLPSNIEIFFFFSYQYFDRNIIPGDIEKKRNQLLIKLYMTSIDIDIGIVGYLVYTLLLCTIVSPWPSQ